MREEELKNKVAQDYFCLFDCTKIIGNVDFCVCMRENQPSLFDQESLLWAEAKRGSSDIYNSIVQLILTIGKARTFDSFLPPPMLGAFDGEKMAFIPYSEIHEVFYQNDFNWNVTPSDYETKEFKLILAKVKSIIDQKTLLFNFENDDKELARFIKSNFVVGNIGLTKTRIDKNNFMVIYNKWLRDVKSTIAVNWEAARKNGIIDGDFYLADLLSSDNTTLKENLFVVLKETRYEFNRFKDEYGALTSSTVEFNDSQKAHTQFWNRYDRPPKEDYWDYIVERRDLLVPQDIRERKGSFFTPQIWVELSQKYITATLGTDWQDEYYVWDCAAGTGNLLNGLTNKYNIWASTLDKQDVEVMHDRIKNGANLLEDHVFQFDFLNDDFSKLPLPLQKIISDPEKRKKLVVYINPPYAESNGRVTTSRNSVQISSIHTKYNSKLEKVGAELYAQFLVRIYFEIPDCTIAEFSKLKLLSGTNSGVFRSHYLAKLLKLFIVPANTFDNVKGEFPIGFFIWDTSIKEKFMEFNCDIFDSEGVFRGKKHLSSYDNEQGRINDWLSNYKKTSSKNIGVLMADAPDFQHNNLVCFRNTKPKGHGIFFPINETNIQISCIYLSVRHCVETTWLNDRDQFLFPNEKWSKDDYFQNDCLTFALFHSQNRISQSDGPNNWIPFTEYEVGAREKFESNFMVQFIQGKQKPTIVQEALFDYNLPKTRNTPLEFSLEAQSVFNAGKELWKYYHKQPNCNVNASLYDIRECFQGRNEKGKMNNKSEDEMYMNLIGELREKIKVLAKKIAQKVYEYGFLKQ